MATIVFVFDKTQGPISAGVGGRPKITQVFLGIHLDDPMISPRPKVGLR
jgi:hypothetical protein